MSGPLGTVSDVMLSERNQEAQLTYLSFWFSTTPEEEVWLTPSLKIYANQFPFQLDGEIQGSHSTGMQYLLLLLLLIVKIKTAQGFPEASNLGDD